MSLYTHNESNSHASELVTYPEYEALKQFHPVAEKWNGSCGLDSGIIKYLSKSAHIKKGDWEFIYHGFDPEAVAGIPLKLCVTIPSTTKRQKRSLKKGIKKIVHTKHHLRELEVDIVEIEKNKKVRLINPPRFSGVRVPPETFEGPLWAETKMGTSFGLAGTNASATIGGRIKIQRKNSKVEEHYFVSAFHPFREIVSARIQMNDRPHEMPPDLFPIVIPSREDTMYTTFEEFRYEEDRSDEIPNLRRRLTTVGGHLVCHARFLPQNTGNATPRSVDVQPKSRRSLAELMKDDDPDSDSSEENTNLGQQKVLDWCLIKPVDSRLMYNWLPPPYRIADNGPPAKTISDLTFDSYHPETESEPVRYYRTGALTKDQYVIKIGRTTGVTVGRIASKNLETKSIESQSYDVWVIDQIPYSGPFVRGGDSGAWVIDMRGYWIGLLIGGTEEGDSGYMLPVGAVIEAIEDKLHCKVIDPERKS